MLLTRVWWFWGDLKVEIREFFWLESDICWVEYGIPCVIMVFNFKDIGVGECSGVVKDKRYCFFCVGFSGVGWMLCC